MADEDQICTSPCTNDTESNTYVTGFEIRYTVENSLAVPDFPSLILAIYQASKENGTLFAGAGSSTPQQLLDISQAQPLVCSDNGNLYG